MLWNPLLQLFDDSLLLQIILEVGVELSCFNSFKSSAWIQVGYWTIVRIILNLSVWWYVLCEQIIIPEEKDSSISCLQEVDTCCEYLLVSQWGMWSSWEDELITERSYWLEVFVEGYWWYWWMCFGSVVIVMVMCYTNGG